VLAGVLVKHAHAGTAGVRITVAAAQLSVEVSDNGVGIAHEAPPGHGLAGLADRIAALDGTLTINSDPSTGTALRAQIPYLSVTAARERAARRRS
jgi:signal transduction histidine kinase